MTFLHYCFDVLLIGERVSEAWFGHLRPYELHE